MLCALYLFTAYISYLFTWKVDQDQVLHFSWGQLVDQDLRVENALGRLGAIVSHASFFWGIGLAAFSLAFVLLRWGLMLVGGVAGSNLFPTLRVAFLIILVGSPMAAFLLGSFAFPFGGAFGNWVSTWLVQFVGTVGTALLFLFAGLGLFFWFRQDLPKADSSWRWPAWRRTRVAAPSDTAVTAQTDWISGSKVKEPEIKREAPIVSQHLELDLKESRAPKEAPVRDTTLEVVATAAEAHTVEQEPVKIVEVKEREKPELVVEHENENHLEPYDPTLELPKYQRPELALLGDYDDGSAHIDRVELEQNKDQIINTLRHYKIEIDRIRATIGPTVTLYEIVPAPGVRISKIKNLEDDIALSLSALGIRIIAPIPGKGTIGIEVPNKNKQTVGLKELLMAEKFKHAKMDLPVALGKTIANEVFIADLAKMPHLLIAGATGQGKSVGINTILMSLLFKKHPSQVKLVLIDPKKVELFPYGRLEKHFLAYLPDQEEPIITETRKVVNTLQSLCLEMDQRYDLLKKAHARNIQEYNAKFTARRLNPNNGHRFLPFIVLVIDEFADLIMTAGKEVELPIARLAQLARAVGIHLIIATQRPSVNIITGVIKANFPARLAFRVTAKVDSRTILDASGADQLIGRGDMLLTVGGDMIRLQCAFVDTPEVEDVISRIADQKGYSTPFFLPEYTGEDSDTSRAGFSVEDLDDMFEEAAELIISTQQGSTSMIQRKLKLGYNRAGRIMDQLEQMGVVGPSEGSKAREVLMTSPTELKELLSINRLQKT